MKASDPGDWKTLVGKLQREDSKHSSSNDLLDQIIPLARSSQIALENETSEILENLLDKHTHTHMQTHMPVQCTLTYLKDFQTSSLYYGKVVACNIVNGETHKD